MGKPAKCERCGANYVADRESRRFCSMTCSAQHVGDLTRRPIADRFWGKVIKGSAPDECWGWSGARAVTKYLGGYGILGGGGRNRSPVGAHRVSWEIHFGPIPAGLLVCHKCDNPACANPAHLFLGTAQDNAIDCARKGRVRGGMPVGKARGSANSQAKLSEASVLEIREAYARGGTTYAALGDKYQVTWTTVRQIVQGKNWSHVGGPRTPSRHRVKIAA